ncbi:MAG: cytochrome c oxidase subunit 4 [Lentimonas sp.]|jgi:cytochrome c oxidase subunit 4
MSEISSTSSTDIDHNDEEQKYHAFINLAMVLAAITGIELVLVYLPLNDILIFTILIGLSLFKFIGVIAWFMHLVYDKLLLTLAFGTGLIIATGTVIALMFIMDQSFVDFEAITAF